MLNLSCLQVRDFAGMGRGVVTLKDLKKGEFVMEYRGDLISGAEGLRREKIYKNDHCYLYFFMFRNRKKW